MSLIAGIDLGTTNSLIGVMDAGFPLILGNSEGERLTPSVVHYSTSGEAAVGRAAERQRALDSRNTVYSVKRFMGRRSGEENVDGYGFLLSGAAGEPLRVQIGERAYAPEEISAEILKKLRRDAEQALGMTVDRAVITVPAYFNDAQRNATKAAGELAGFTVERIVNEPTAAALCHGLDRLEERSRIAVYDLGGGTFDVSILELNRGVFEVLSTNGNTRLGGDDIDRAIVKHLVSEALGDEAAALDDAGWARVREAAISAKHRLTTEESVEVSLPFLSGAKSLSVQFTRAALERLARPIVEKTRSHWLRALADAKLQREDLNRVLLVGGQTRMPLVREFVAELAGQAPDVSENPDEAVAMGAVIQAGVLSGSVQNVILLDVTPLSLGIETFGGLMNVIIPRNTTIPCKAGEMFTNAVAGQESMLIRVLQGEREMSRDNWELGKFELTFTKAPKGQARVGVQFEIDANGILRVLARDTATGSEKIVEISSAVDVSDEAVEKMLEDSLEHAFEDVGERAFTEARIKVDSFLPTVRNALAKLGDAISVEERGEIDRLIQELEAALATGAAAPVKKALAALDDATQPLAALLVEQALRQSGAAAPHH